MLSSHLANGATYASNSSTLGVAGSTFNASKLDLNALLGKKKTIHNFIFSGGSNSSNSGGGSGGISGSTNGAVSDLIGSADGQVGGGNHEQNSFFSFSKTSHSLSINSYLRENRLNMPFVSNLLLPIIFIDMHRMTTCQIDHAESHSCLCT